MMSMSAQNIIIEYQGLLHAPKMGIFHASEIIQPREQLMRYSIVEGAVNPESCLFPLPPLSPPSSFLFFSLPLPISLSTSDAPPSSPSLPQPSSLTPRGKEEEGPSPYKQFASAWKI
jgi:hypothetical protein